MTHRNRIQNRTKMYRCRAARHLRHMKTLSFGLAVSLSMTIALLAVGCAPTTTERLGLEPPVTISDFEIERYDGVWFEIGNYPNTFQAGCAGTTAEYRIQDNGEVTVDNSCTVNGEPNQVQGIARPVDLDEGKLEVSFFGPFFGDYWIVELGEEDGPTADYTYAAVTSPSRDFLWILSRTPTLDEGTLDGIFERLEEQGIDRERFVFTPSAE